MTLAFHQLPLQFVHQPSYAPEDFIAGPSNASALALVHRWPHWSHPHMLLVGQSGSGKSHLAAIWRQSSHCACVSARDLNKDQVPELVAHGAVTVEDVDLGLTDEAALFHLLNLARSEGASLLLTARDALQTWDVQLKDLQSRLRALPVVALLPPDDTLLHAVLMKLFSDRQLQVEPAVVAYLVKRMDRDLKSAVDIVATLDALALAEKRPLTRSLAAKLFPSEEQGELPI